VNNCVEYIYKNTQYTKFINEIFAFETVREQYFRRVSEIDQGYRKCTKGIGKLKKLNTGFQSGIGNIQRVSKILGGYWKCTKGIGKLKKLNTGFQ
jgi:hypothetical protein